MSAQIRKNEWYHKPVFGYALVRQIKMRFSATKIHSRTRAGQIARVRLALKDVIKGMTMKQIFAVLLLVACSAAAKAKHLAPALQVEEIRLIGAVAAFGTNIQPDHTCDHFGEYFVFDHTTAIGKHFLMVLLEAKRERSLVSIWFTESSATGANQVSGCTETSMAELVGVSIQ